jgi:hypothetical protein
LHQSTTQTTSGLKQRVGIAVDRVVFTAITGVFDGVIWRICRDTENQGSADIAEHLGQEN